MKSFIKALRLFVRIGLGVILLTVVVSVSLGGWLQTDAGQSKAKQWLMNLISDKSGYGIELGEIQVTFPLTLQLSHLKINDQRGLWLSAHQIQTSLVPYVGIDKLGLQHVYAEQIDILRSPSLPDKPRSRSSKTHFTLTVQQVDTPSLRLREALTRLPHDLQLSVSGRYEFPIHERKMTFSAEGDLDGSLFSTFSNVHASASGSYSLKEKRLDLDIHHVDSDQGQASTQTPLVVDVENETLAAEFIVPNFFLEEIHKDIKAQVSGVVTLAGSFGEPQIKFDGFHRNHAEVSGVTFPAGQWAGHWTYQQVSPGEEKVWLGSTHLNVEDWSLFASSQMTLTTEAIFLDELKLKVPGNQMIGHLSFGFDDTFVNAQLDGKDIVWNQPLFSILEHFSPELANQDNWDEWKDEFSGKADIYFQLHKPVLDTKKLGFIQGALVKMEAQEVEFEGMRTSDIHLVANFNDLVSLKPYQWRLDIDGLNTPGFSLEQLELISQPLENSSSNSLVSEWDQWTAYLRAHGHISIDHTDSHQKTDNAREEVVDKEIVNKEIANKEPMIPISLNSEGHVSWSKKQGISLVLPKFVGEVDGYQIKAKNPLELTGNFFGQGDFKLSWVDSEFQLGAGDKEWKNALAILKTSGNIKNQDISSRMSVSGLRLSTLPASILGSLDSIVDEKTLNRSTVDGSAEISGKVSQPSIKGDIHLLPIWLHEHMPLVQLAGEWTVDQGMMDSRWRVTHKEQDQESKIDIEAESKGDEATETLLSGVEKHKKLLYKELLKAEIRVPLELSFYPWKFLFDENAPLKGDLQFETTAETWLNRMVALPQHISGELTGNLALDGSLTQPEFSGFVSLNQGRYKNSEIGVLLKNVEAHFEAEGQRLTLNQFRAQDRKGRLISGQGHIDVNVFKENIKQVLPYEFHLSTKKFSGIKHPVAESIVSADVDIVGDLSGAKVTGVLDVLQLDIRLPEKFTASIPSLNVVSTVDEQGVETIIHDESDVLYPVNLDLKINANKQVFVRGWGVEAELGGKLRVRGDITSPFVLGSLEVLRGRYEEFGRRFDIEEGTLNFVGDLPPSPYLNITTQAQAGDVKIRPVLTGSILTPELSIESEPELPQEEALSLLLFGKETQKISSVQAIQLASSLGRLSGQGGGAFDPISKVRQLMKVDALSVETTGEDQEDTTIGIGKYVTDDVYLQIERGTEEGSGKAKVEIEVSPNVSLETTTGEADEHGVGINWKLDY